MIHQSRLLLYFCIRGRAAGKVGGGGGGGGGGWERESDNSLSVNYSSQVLRPAKTEETNSNHQSNKRQSGEVSGGHDKNSRVNTGHPCT